LTGEGVRVARLELAQAASAASGGAAPGGAGRGVRIPGTRPGAVPRMTRPAPGNAP